MGQYTRVIKDIDENGEVVAQKDMKCWDGWNEKVQGYFYRYKTHVVKFYPDCIPNLSSANLGRLVLLSQFILPNTNLFAKKVRRKTDLYESNIVPLTKPEMMSKIDLKCADTFGRFWKELKDANVVKRIKVDGQLFWAANPYYFNCCKHVPYWIYFEFKHDMDKYLTPRQRNRYATEILNSDRYVDNLN